MPEASPEGGLGNRKEFFNSQSLIPTQSLFLIPNPMPNNHYTQKLQNLMQRVGISSFKALSRAAGVSERQILRLRQGKLEQMRVDVLLKLSQIVTGAIK